MRRLGFSVLTAVLFVFASSSILRAQARQQQQKQQSGDTKKKVPSLSTDDVLGDRAAATTVEETGDKGAKPGVSEQKEKDKVSPDEAAWREEVKNARKRAEDLQRQAEDVEVGITRLRNQLNAPGQTPGERNQILQQIDDAGRNVAALKEQAQQAKSELDRILQEGSAKGYSESAGPAPTKDGEPNEDYYRSKFAELLQKLQDAQRQAELYDNRVKQINADITNNTRSGDNFYISKLQQDLAEARQNLSDAQDAYAKAQQAIDALKEEARQAGVPPGVFREAGQ